MKLVLHISERSNMGKEKEEISIRSSAAEYLTYIASVGDNESVLEVRYQDENIWLTQKMMSMLYDVSVAAISQHIKRIYEDGELPPEATIKKYLTVQMDEKYRIVQDELYESDFDRYLLNENLDKYVE